MGAHPPERPPDPDHPAQMDHRPSRPRRDWVTLLGPGAGPPWRRALGFGLRSAARPRPASPRAAPTCSTG